METKSPDKPVAGAKTLAAALGAGALFVPLKLIYSFFPIANLIDVVVFGFTGYFFGARSPAWWWIAALLVSIPALALVVAILGNLGLDNLRAGIGVGWAVSAVLLPVCALVGAHLGRRSR